jgi:hypothetical protein
MVRDVVFSIDRMGFTVHQIQDRRQFLQLVAAAGFGVTATARGQTPDEGALTPPRGRGHVRPLDPVALDDILVGCSYLGCGGGGSLADGRARLAVDVQAQLSFSLLDVAGVGDDEWVASPYGLGSLALPTDVQQQQFAGLTRVADPVEASFRMLSRHLQRAFVAAVAGELGPWSTAAALSTAARCGIPLLDADRVGRAAPEATQDSVLAAGLSNLPIAAVTCFGDEIILEKVARGARSEDLLRALSVASLGDLGVTDAALSGRTVRESGALIAGTITHAEALGRAVRSAKAGARSPLNALLEAGGGERMFEGRVIECSWKDEAGFLIGEVHLDGEGSFAGHRYRVHFKNENIIAWRDEAVSVLPPELISIVDAISGEAVANPEFVTGARVAVLRFPAPSIWHTAQGLRLFGPAHFGY